MNNLAFWWFGASIWNRAVTICSVTAILLTIGTIYIFRPRGYEGSCAQAISRLSALTERLQDIKNEKSAQCDNYRKYVEILDSFEGRLAICVSYSKGDINRAYLAAQRNFYKRLQVKTCSE